MGIVRSSLARKAQIDRGLSSVGSTHVQVSFRLLSFQLFWCVCDDNDGNNDGGGGGGGGGDGALTPEFSRRPAGLVLSAHLASTDVGSHIGK